MTETCFQKRCPQQGRTTMKQQSDISVPRSPDGFRRLVRIIQIPDGSAQHVAVESPKSAELRNQLGRSKLKKPRKVYFPLGSTRRSKQSRRKPARRASIA